MLLSCVYRRQDHRVLEFKRSSFYGNATPYEDLAGMSITTSLYPDCVSWSSEEVANWIEEIGYKQYKVILG